MNIRLLISGTVLTLLLWVSWGAGLSEAASVRTVSDGGWMGAIFATEQLSQLKRAHLGVMLPYRPVVVSTQKRLVGMPVLKRPGEAVPSPDELISSGARIPFRPRRISTTDSVQDVELVKDE